MGKWTAKSSTRMRSCHRASHSMMMTPHRAVMRKQRDSRIVCYTDVGCRPATRIEAAAGRESGHRRHDAGDLRQAMSAMSRAGAQQREGCNEPLSIGMTGCSEHILGSPLLDNSPRIHHADATAHIGNETEIVTDHQNGRSPLGTKIADEVEDFSLNRDVQCCRRFVREQQVRAARQRNGDHDPLAHASRQLMRIILDPPLRAGTRTLASASTACRSASFQVAPLWSTNISAIWRPTGDNGLSAVIGS